MWASLHCHDFLSLLDGLSSPLDNFTQAINGGLSGLAITNHGNISSVIKVLKSRKQYIEKTKSLIEKTSDNQLKDCYLQRIDKANKLKLILGNEMYLAVGEKENAHLVVLAKNLRGYRQLVKATSESTRRDNFFRKPRLTLEQLSEYAGDLIVINGHPGSSLYNVLWVDIKASFNAHSYEEAKQLVHPEWRKRVLDCIGQFREVFGENFFLESQLIDAERLPAAQIAVNIYRWASKKTGVRVVCTSDSHYPTRERAQDQRILLCSALKTTLPKIQRQLDIDADDVGMSGFFLSDKYYLPSAVEMVALHPEDELRTSCEISESVEQYDLSNKPIIPKFECPEGFDADSYMIELCRRGYKNKLSHLIGESRKLYGDRVNHELEVLQGAGLSNYFLIVQDIMNWTKSQGYLVGPGRGCLGPNTKILMENGSVKDICDIKDGEYVYTKNGHLKKVLNRFKYNNTESLISIKCYYGDKYGISLTKNHKVLVEKAVFNHKEKKYERPIGNLEWIQADQIKKNDWVFYPKINLNRSDCFLDLKIFCDTELLEYDDNYVYQYRMNHSVKQFVNKCKRFISFDEDFCKLLGYFTGDGCIRKSQDYNGYFCFHIDHLDKIKFIKDVLEKYEFSFTERTQAKHKSHQIVVNSKFFYRLIKYLYNQYEFTSITKHVPFEIFNLCKSNIRSFLDGYMWADGYIGQTINSKSISEKLSYQIRFLFYILDIPSSINHYQPNDKRCKINNVVHSVIVSKTLLKQNDNTQDFSNVEIIESGFLLRVYELKECNSDYVYDLEVENEHNYCTTSFVVHNSAAGCLVSYLLGITSVDSVKYNLLFERFYNAGRNSPERISMPDCDCDIQATAREKVVNYIKDKYGHSKVGQISNYGRLQGKACLKDVLRAHESCDFVTMNNICKYLMDEAAIADDLNEMQEEIGSKSIIRWGLENNPKELSEWAYLAKDGSIQGPLAAEFSQAIRLEGTYRQRGIHAAAIVIYPDDITDICPVIYDKEGNSIISFDMHDVEYTGGNKLDILGLTILDKIQSAKLAIESEFIIEEDDEK